MVLTEEQLERKIKEIVKEYKKIIDIGVQLDKYIDKILEKEGKDKGKFLKKVDELNLLCYDMSKKFLEDITGQEVKDVNLGNINKNAKNTDELELGIHSYLFLRTAHNVYNNTSKKMFKEELEKNGLEYFPQEFPYIPTIKRI